MPTLSTRARQLLDFIQQDRNDSFSKFALALELQKLGFDSNKVEALFLDILNNDPSYVGLYYHYGAFLEEHLRNEEALNIYVKGIQIATELKEMHALSELKQAKMQLELEA